MPPVAAHDLNFRMNEQIKKERIISENETFTAQVMDKIRDAIESDEHLHAGLFLEFQARPNGGKCYRVYRAVVEVQAFVPIDS